MRSLFAKILLWFWAAIVAVGWAVVGTIYLTQTEPAFVAWSDAVAKAAAIYAHSAAELYEREGPEGVRQYFTRLEQTAELHPLLFDDTRRELLGQPLPRDLSELLTRAQHSGRREFLLEMRYVYLAQRTVTASNRPYVLVVQTTRTFPFGDDATFQANLLRTFVILLTVGTLCYGLARHLTSPIARLRAAAHQFAGGDLSVRVGKSLGKRRDEIADLGRDFDQMAERIESLLSAQRRLLSDISHELRSPLARLNVALELARQRAGADAQGALERIEREAARLNELIGQLLTLSRLESGTQSLDRQPVDLSRLVAEVGEDAAFEAQSTQRTVKVKVAEPCLVKGSETLLRSALENVVRNALRYTPEHSVVEVVLQADPAVRAAFLTVRDHGPGVPAGALESIFRPFYRVADARDRKTGGVGLGLAITQRAVHWHGGDVTAENAQNGGLIVRLRLPLAAADETRGQSGNPAQNEIDH